MDKADDFFNQLNTAIDQQQAWLELQGMHELVKNYKIYYELTSKIFEVFLSKGLVQDDPYKDEKKVLDIELITDEPFTDTDKSVELGIRFSDYIQMMQHISTYFRFSISALSIERLKILLTLNNTFNWSALGNTSANPNTKALSDTVGLLRQRGDNLSLSTISDSITQLVKYSSLLHTLLTEVLIFQEELYKESIRKIVFESIDFSSINIESLEEIYEKALSSFREMNLQKSWHEGLIRNLINENFSHDKEVLREQVLERLKTKSNHMSESGNEINTKNIILDAICILATLAPQLDTVLTKIDANKTILEKQHINFFTKLTAFLKKVFNVSEKSPEYKLKIFDPISHNMKTEVLIVQDFLNSIRKKAKFYGSLTPKSSQGYVKICQHSEEKIFTFVSEQIHECNKTLTFLNALDVFFKSNATETNRSKIRGLKIELGTIKTILLKVNKAKAEYTAYMEQEKQLKQLGIANV
ncbi:MAG: hypothetical protein ACRC4W_05690 [Treponemataceae bacterium]